MKGIALLAFITLFTKTCFSQGPIIDNTNFENFPAAWYTIKTVDHGSGTIYVGPYSVQPVDGDYLIGLRFNSAGPWDDWQEYVWQYLNYPLTPGHKYQFRVWVHLAHQSLFTTDDFGIAFIDNDDGLMNTNPELAVTSSIPDIKMENGDYLQREWVMLSGTYTAQGNEVAIAIGCFKNDATLNMVPAPPVTTPYNEPSGDIYVFLDDVNLFECIDPPPSLPDFILCERDSITIDASWPNTQYSWGDGSTDSMYRFLPNMRDTVTLFRQVHGCYYYDTAFVNVFSGPSDTLPDAFVCENADFPMKYTTNAFPDETVLWSNGTEGTQVYLHEPDIYTVTKTLGECEWKDTFQISSAETILYMYPNPGKDDFSALEQTEISVTAIYDNKGQLIENKKLKGQQIGRALRLLSPAIYLITMEYEGCERTVKFVKSQ